MALDLTLVDPKLKTAQDGILHNPIIEILSSQWTNDIPFDGQFLDGISNETDPSVIVHSSGRLCLIYILNGYLHYVYTDTDRTEFNHVSFTDYNVMKNVSLCELTDGNIGIFYCYQSSGNYYVRYKIISVTGTQLFDGAIFNQADTIYLSGPCVITLANDTYMMVYAKKSGSDYYLYERTSTDFKTGWAESQLSVGALTSTKRIGHPSLFQISTGDIFLWFDYLESVGPNGEELTNIYYSIGQETPPPPPPPVTDDFGASTEQDIKSGGDGEKLYGWFVLNSASADVIDANITNAGKLTIDCNAVSSNWRDAQHDGVFIYKNINGDFDVDINFSDNINSNYEGIGLMARDPTASVGEDWVAIKKCFDGYWYSGLVIKWITTTNDVSSGEYLNGIEVNHTYLRMTRVGNVFTLYSKENIGDSWIQRAQYTRNDFAFGIQVGICTQTINTENDLVLQVNYFEDI